MNGNRKVMLCIIGLVLLLVATLGVTYSFFNYTKTGLLNNIGTGRIYFNSEQNGKLTLTNVFPMTKDEVEEANLDTVSVTIEGDTTYHDGEEFEIRLTNVNNTVNGKTIPLSFMATYEAVNGKSIGTSSDDYWNSRESKDANIYTLVSDGAVTEHKQLLVGFIKSGDTGINGTLTIKAYIDADKVAISDTYNIFDGTTSEWVNGRDVFTTEEWNNIKNNPISFKISVESNEGLWVEPYSTPMSCFYAQPVNAIVNDLSNPNYSDALDFCVSYFSSYYFGSDEEAALSFCKGNGTLNGSTFQEKINQDDFPFFETRLFVANNLLNFDNVKVYSYKAPVTTYKLNQLDETQLNKCMNALSYGTSNEPSFFENFCNGTGKVYNRTFQQRLNEYSFDDKLLKYFVENGIISSEVIGDTSCGSDVVIPSELPVFTNYTLNNLNDSSNADALNNCVNYLISSYGDEEEGVNIASGETYEDFCRGTGTLFGDTFQEWIENGYLSDSDIEHFIYYGIINEEYSERKYPVVEINELAFSSPHVSESYMGRNVTNLTIPNSVRIIGKEAFAGNKLKKLVIPNGVTTIGDYAFSYNYLTDVSIADSVTVIGNGAFEVNQLETIQIPSGITTISYSLFYANKLTSVIIPDTITEIEGNAFRDNQLTNITISNSVVNIGNAAFENNKLSSVTIPNSVTTIDNYAFSENKLSSVTISSSITRIGTNAFFKESNSNPNLASITIDKSCSAIKGMANYAWIGNNYKAGTTIYGSNNEVCDSW